MRNRPVIVRTIGVIGRGDTTGRPARTLAVPGETSHNRGMTTPFVYRRRVQFRDTDAAGIMHFSVYFLLMEEAEHAFLRQAGTSVVLHDEQGTISWPRIAAKCDFRASARFEDELAINISITRLGDRSVTYRFEITRSEQVLAVGEMTAVCCRVFPHQPPHSIVIPADLRSALQQYVRSEA